MPGVDLLFAYGGPLSLIGAVIIAAKYGVDAVNAWRTNRPTKVPQINDAATLNSLLLKALDKERANSEEKDRRIKTLETDMDVLRKLLYEQSDNYEKELFALRRELEQASTRLAGLERRLTTDFKREDK
jgi:hypothetical protein